MCVEAFLAPFPATAEAPPFSAAFGVAPKLCVPLLISSQSQLAKSYKSEGAVAKVRQGCVGLTRMMWKLLM